jgi:phage shock protein PspC (stress-responsive transcriptional regulator)
MESHDQDPTTAAGAGAGSEDPTTPHTGPHRPAARRLYKSSDDRMIAGVCGGLADYFGIDPVIVRVVAVALVFAGGAGLLAYVAAWLLVPEQGAGPDEGPGRTATIAGVIALVVAVCVLLPLWNGPFGGHWSGPFVGLVFIGLAGLGVWYLASGEQPGAGGVRDILRRAGFGLALLAVCGILAVGGAWATAAGGGTVVAVVIVVLGVWLVASAFIGGARWLILPALALALPAGVVSAADLDVRGGIGERQYHPLGAAQVRDTYRLGVGQLIVDLRDAKLPAGDRRVHIDLGVGQAVLVVPRDACVATAARIGAGQVSVFDRSSEGVDVNWQDERTAPARTARIVVDGDVGVGQLAVTYQDADSIRHRGFHDDTEPGNATCIGGARG